MDGCAVREVEVHFKGLSLQGLKQIEIPLQVDFHNIWVALGDVYHGWLPIQLEVVAVEHFLSLVCSNHKLRETSAS